MKSFTLIATTAFGLEAIARRELQALGIEILKTDNGRVYFQGSFKEIALANLYLRTADRVFIELANFKAEEFKDLFNGVNKIPWFDILPKNANFVVNAKSVRSKLFSIRSCQSVSEKAIVKNLRLKYKVNRFEKSGALYNIQISLLDDYASIRLDTTGPSLHRRGYRKKQGSAPLKETMAAAMVLLSFWNPQRLLYDPFCGSGTILVEAALIGKNIAPGSKRSFAFNNWSGVDHSFLREAKEFAQDNIKDIRLNLVGTDIDPMVLDLAKEIVEDIEFDKDIKLYNMDFKDYKIQEKYGVMITNPPYGKRLKQSKTDSLARDMADKFRELSTWSSYILTADSSFERNYGKKADRKRKLFNGRIKSDFYQYHGQRPKGEI